MGGCTRPERAVARCGRRTGLSRTASRTSCSSGSSSRRCRRPRRGRAPCSPAASRTRGTRRCSRLSEAIGAPQSLQVSGSMMLASHFGQRNSTIVALRDRRGRSPPCSRRRWRDSAHLAVLVRCPCTKASSGTFVPSVSSASHCGQHELHDQHLLAHRRPSLAGRRVLLEAGRSGRRRSRRASPPRGRRPRRASRSRAPRRRAQSLRGSRSSSAVLLALPARSACAQVPRERPARARALISSSRSKKCSRRSERTFSSFTWRWSPRRRGDLLDGALGRVAALDHEPPADAAVGADVGLDEVDALELARLDPVEDVLRRRARRAPSWCWCCASRRSRRPPSPTAARAG